MGAATPRPPSLPLALPLPAQVLLQEPNPGIEYEFWLPRGHPQPGRGDTSPLRQPQPRGAGSPPPQEPPVTPAPTPPSQPGGSATEPPPRNPPGRSGAGAAAGACSPVGVPTAPRTPGLSVWGGSWRASGLLHEMGTLKNVPLT